MLIETSWLDAQQTSARLLLLRSTSVHACWYGNDVLPLVAYWLLKASTAVFLSFFAASDVAALLVAVGVSGGGAGGGEQTESRR